MGSFVAVILCIWLINGMLRSFLGRPQQHACRAPLSGALECIPLLGLRDLHFGAELVAVVPDYHFHVELDTEMVYVM